MEKCGCRVRRQGQKWPSIPYGYSIDFCLLHAAAGEMLEVLKETCLFLRGEALKSVRQAITKAEAKGE